MNWRVICVICALGLLVILALAKIIKDKNKRKGCNGNCAGCSAACKQRIEKEDENGVAKNPPD